jgi:hypothetical protein
MCARSGVLMGDAWHRELLACEATEQEGHITMAMCGIQGMVSALSDSDNVALQYPAMETLIHH